MKVSWIEGKRGGPIIRCTLRCNGVPDVIMGSKSVYRIRIKDGRIVAWLYGPWIQNYKRQKCWVSPERTARRYVARKLLALARELPKSYTDGVPTLLLKEWLAPHISEERERELAKKIRELAAAKLADLHRVSRKLESKCEEILND